MIDPKNPLEVARETFRLLSLRKLLPTPANYQACYNEVAKLPNVAGFPEAPMRQLAAALGRLSPEAGEQHLAALEAAIGKRSWQGVQEALVAFSTRNKPSVAPADRSEASPANSDSTPALHMRLLPPLVHLVEGLLPSLCHDDDSLLAQGRQLLQTLEDQTGDCHGVLTRLAAFSQRISLIAEEQGEVRLTLLKLLQLIVDNIAVLSVDERSVQGQIDTLARAVLPPLTLRRLDDVERRLQDVIGRQRAAKERTLAAQEAMRAMLAAFIDQLATMNQSSTAFQNNLEESALQIADVQTIEDLTPLLRRVLTATRSMATETAAVRDQLGKLQTRVLDTNTELARLQEELQQASAAARHDPLTDVLNRRGLDEALAREIASMRRKTEQPLSLSLLDVDNFKQINDRLGHATGDDALIHLVRVVRQYMRPVDTLARYGGEEFVILMPDTLLADGMTAMRRLQRELTRNFFLAGNEKVLITFSAGVAELLPEESGEDAIRRADQAMYLAKRAGKNRVMGA
ncbi:GGDEF domain-containing protein [Accumulibacter sp.]|jgi:diguanylate cyclase|uniref:GGDEF domain-containing protein n=1 Tax=Accumulibacter sp. TaxID=2053492 RepID=UPI001AC77C88|nr:GGDEF domain-containing protein [Accumulibacter sp.]MBN8451911.1 diguanylate cyclase [Accumulibacter sp.]MBO3711027.1 diguanylate cyclase [Accumulibacter sp.]